MRLRCASLARELGLDPISTQKPHEGVLLVEWPGPWTRDVSTTPGLSRLQPHLERTRTRLQLVRRLGHRPADRRIVAYHREVPGWFGGYRSLRVEVDSAELLTAALEVLDRPLTDFSAVAVRKDILVCAHGARDVCCGSLGTKLLTSTQLTDGLETSGVDVWMSSHLGGHRFAPTVWVLPDGTLWGYMDSDNVLAVARRDGPVEPACSRFRGTTAKVLDEVALLERVAFAEIGWAWWDYKRRGRRRASGVLELDAVSPSGTASRWTGVSRMANEVRLPDCMSMDGTSGDLHQVFVLDAYSRRPS